LSTAVIVVLVLLMGLWVWPPVSSATGKGATDQSATYKVRNIKERWVMPDGTKLPVSVYWPATLNPFARFPIVIFMHP